MPGTCLSYSVTELNSVCALYQNTPNTLLLLSSFWLKKVKIPYKSSLILTDVDRNSEKVRPRWKVISIFQFSMQDQKISLDFIEPHVCCASFISVKKFSIFQNLNPFEVRCRATNILVNLRSFEKIKTRGGGGMFPLFLFFFFNLTINLISLKAPSSRRSCIQLRHEFEE